MRTAEEQRQIAIGELHSALDAVRNLAEEIDKIQARLKQISHDLCMAEDNARAGGLSWLELDPEEMTKVLADQFAEHGI